MRKFFIIPFIILIILLVLNSCKAYAYDYIPYNNVNGTNTFLIYDFINITATDYLCVAGTCYNSFAGSGTVTSVATDNIYLTGGPITSSGTITLNETKLNQTIGNLSLSSVAWNDVTSKPFTGVDTTQGLRIVSQILGINHTYMSGLYNQTSQVNSIKADITANRSTWEQDTTYSNTTPITLTGTTFGLINCPDTQGLFYNSTYGNWQCQPKTSGAGGGTVTSVSGDGKYVTGTITTSGTFGFNELNLNNTIDARSVNYDNYTSSLAFTGTTTKTLTLTMANSGTVSNTFTDIDTTYSAGNGISLATTTFSVAGNTCLDQDSDGLSVTANCIGNTQLEYDTGQALTTTSTPTFASLSTGQGQYELYAMNQDVETTDAVTFATVNTGQGANELYDMDQNVLTTSDVEFNTIYTPNYVNISGHYQCVNSTDTLILTTDFTKCQT